MRRAPVAILLGSVLLAVAGCGAASHAGAGTGTKPPPAGSAPEAEAPLPAGPHPSNIAMMVCAVKAQNEIGEVLGVTASVSAPTWVHHLYSCAYRYATGSFTMSVKELSSWPQTLSYFHDLGRRLGDREDLGNLGQGAFTTSNGSVVVRKDWKVLLVNIATLPPEFGKPPTGSPEVAFTVADVILGCWHGD